MLQIIQSWWHQFHCFYITNNSRKVQRHQPATLKSKKSLNITTTLLVDRIVFRLFTIEHGIIQTTFKCFFDYIFLILSPMGSSRRGEKEKIRDRKQSMDACRYMPVCIGNKAGKPNNINHVGIGLTVSRDLIRLHIQDQLESIHPGRPRKVVNTCTFIRTISFSQLTICRCEVWKDSLRRRTW